MSRNSLLVAIVVFGSLCTGLLTGWLASRHLVLSSEEEGPSKTMITGGGASEEVRRGVLQALHAFQDGYTRRDVNHLPTFMSQLFPPSEDSVVIGTEPGEVIQGHEQIEHFIRSDWAGWGDVRLDVVNALVFDVGDAAWLTTLGSVRLHGSLHPMRFTATLICQDGRWVFRQVQFKWEDRIASLRQMLQPSAFWRLRLR